MSAHTDEDGNGTAADEQDVRAYRRSSHRRVMRCERNLRRISRSYKATLSINEGHRTAHIDMESDPSHAVVSGREFEQPVTDYSPLAWDWLCQRCLTAHEAAHGRYTNHDDFMQRLDEYDKRQKGIVKNLWNAAEDCAIEANLRRAIPAYDSLIAAFRANLMASNNPDTVSLARATSMAILEKGTYESGRVENLINPRNKDIQFASSDDRETFVNEIAPAVDNLLQDILEEPNAKERNKRTFQFVDEVLEHIENADDPDSDVDEKGDSEGDGASQPQQGREESDQREDETGQPQQGDEEGNQGSGSQESGEDNGSPQQGAGGMPNDADNMEGKGEAEEADELDGAETDANGHVEAPSSSDDVTTDPSVQQDLQQDVESEGENLPTPGGSGNPNGGVENERIDTQKDRPTRLNSATWEQAMSEADRLQRVLEDLTASDKSRRKRHQRRGRIDGSSLHRLKTGEKRVKMRQRRPDEPDMGFVLVVDRSGSMGGSLISSAEKAAVGFAEALERVGIDVMVVGLHDGRVREELAFDEDTHSRRTDLANGETDGGTPLSDALRMARKRIRAEDFKERRVLVISDDRPNSPAKYRQEVQKCSFPVVGVLLSNGADLKDYTRAVESAPSGSTLSTDLQKLARELVHST